MCTDEKVCLNKDIYKVQTSRKNVPDYLAIFEQDLNNPNSEDLKDKLTSMGLDESEKLKHALKGISFARLSSRTDRYPDDDVIVRLPGRFGLKLHFEHMLVFSNNQSTVKQKKK